MSTIASSSDGSADPGVLADELFVLLLPGRSHREHSAADHEGSQALSLAGSLTGTEENHNRRFGAKFFTYVRQRVAPSRFNLTLSDASDGAFSRSEARLPAESRQRGSRESRRTSS